MINTILTDIEGTTSSLSFVKDVLFPYAREHLGKFVEAHADDPAVARELAEVRRLAGADLHTVEVIAQLTRWIDEDKKITPLKSLQGMIWEQGYKKGDFKGHVYEDAVRNLKKWHAAGLKLYVFSSGSVQAQKLLFGHSEHGDLTPLFSGYFDTNVGNKREVESYRRIASDIGTPPGEILFLSDIKEELDAAGKAGLRTVLLTREGAFDAGGSHVRARNFDEIAV